MRAGSGGWSLRGAFAALAAAFCRMAHEYRDGLIAHDVLPLPAVPMCHVEVVSRS